MCDFIVRAKTTALQVWGKSTTFLSVTLKMQKNIGKNIGKNLSGRKIGVLLRAFSGVKQTPYRRKGTLAQVVEQWTENPCVLGSTPRGTTFFSVEIRVEGLEIYFQSIGSLDEWFSQRSAKPSTAVRIRWEPQQTDIRSQYCEYAYGDLKQIVNFMDA